MLWTTVGGMGETAIGGKGSCGMKGERVEGSWRLGLTPTPVELLQKGFVSGNWV